MKLSRLKSKTMTCRCRRWLRRELLKKGWRASAPFDSHGQTAVLYVHLKLRRSELGILNAARAAGILVIPEEEL